MPTTPRAATDKSLTPAPTHATPGRFASPPIVMCRTQIRGTTPQPLTLGEILTAATKNLSATLPAPGKRPRQQPLNFSPRRGRSAAASSTHPAAPPTAERPAYVQVLRTLGIVGVNQKITQAEMQAYDGVLSFFLLTYPMRMVLSLQISLWIPIAVVKNYNMCSGQVDTNTTCPS